MSKWVIIGISAVILTLVAGGIIYYLGSKDKDSYTGVPKLFNLIQKNGSSGSQAGAETKKDEEKTYEDASGFSFKYSKDLTAGDVTPGDNAYYSVVSVKKGSQELKITTKDVSYSSLEDWLSKDKDAPKGTTLVGAVTLSGISAKQYVYGSRLITAAVDKKILFTIDSLRDPNLWDKVHDRIVSSFTFVNPEATPVPGSSGSGSSGAGDNAIYETEEVVE